MVGRFAINNKFGTKYAIDELSFAEIKDEASAYFLGFLYADGSIGHYNGDYSIRIELQDQDRKILEDFRDFVKSNRPISDSYKKGKKYCAMRISNKTIYTHLTNKGIMPRKTFTISFPSEDIVPKHLLSHFIRGYFDGDGCITCSKNKQSSISFTITSNLHFLEGLQEFLINELGFSKTKITATKSIGIGTLVYSGSLNAKKFYNFIYQDAKFYLTRKFEKFSSVLKNIQKLKQKSYSLISPTGQVFGVFNLREFSSQHKISKKSIYALAKGEKDSVKGWKLLFKI
jgi:intein/homing endonuclease